MKVTITCLEEKTDSIKSEIEELGIEIKLSDEDSIVIETSEQGYEKVVEIPGVISATKSNVFDYWK